MPVTSNGTIECEVYIEAQPATVFPFFIDPDQMVRWMGSAATLDPAPGGRLQVQVAPGELARGAYVEIDPPHRVVFTWGWDGEGHPLPSGSSTVEVTLTADGPGTHVRLIHRDIANDEVRANHEVGWTHFLARLAIVGAGGDAGPNHPPGA